MTKIIAQEISVDATRTLRVMRTGKVYTIERKMRLGWRKARMFESATAYRDSHVALHEMSRESLAFAFKTQGADALPVYARYLLAAVVSAHVDPGT